MSSIKRIVIIGTGNVAWHFSHELFNAGLDIVQVYGRKTEKAQRLANPLAAEAIDSFTSLVEDAHLYLICISDDSIGQIAQNLNHVNGIVAHTSGAINIDVLNKLQEFGVFYPLQTLAHNKAVDFEEVPFLIEGSSSKTEASLMSLAFELSQKVYAISSAQRQKVHVAAVFANNFTNHMLAQAQRICNENQIPFEVLQPLIDATLKNASERNLATSQTGPAKRGDELTIAKHMSLLQDDMQQKLYELITKSIQQTDETKL